MKKNTTQMASDTLVSDTIDPLNGLNGPLLFPRTIRASVGDGSVPADFKNLESTHNFMKSLELRSPEKLMSEAKRIVDGGLELLECSLVSIAEKVDKADPVAAKGKDKPRERRPGLGLARKKGSLFSKTSLSQPSVVLDTTLNFDELEDPNEFFDAYEKMEKANKEIQRQLGGSIQVNPPTRARVRGPGILGKKHSIKDRYSSLPCKDDEMLMSSQDTVNQSIPGSYKDNSQEKLSDMDPDPDVDVTEVELASSKKVKHKVSDMLDELLSLDYEDLDGDGALNILQERLNIEPPDLDNLSMPALNFVGNNNILNAGDMLKSRMSSRLLDSALKNLNSKSPTEPKQAAQNRVSPFSSPNPPRSPFASLSLLKKKIFQPSTLNYPFSPLDVNASTFRSTSPIQPIDKLQEHNDAPPNLRMSGELESYVDIEIPEPTLSNMDAQKVVESEDILVYQLVDDYTDIETANVDSKENEVPDCNTEETLNIENKLVDENTCIETANADNNENEVLDCNTEETINIENLNNYQSNLSKLQDVAMDNPSRKQQFNAESQPEVNQANSKRVKKETGKKRIRRAHPMRKSMAESGTSFDTGVRRSKRIKMRPLEYWKGERFLYGRVDDSLKLLGVKYLSPGKSNEGLKVKPYISSGSSKYKEVIDLAARY